MSLFRTCESCGKLETRACGCKNPCSFYCDTHAMSHVLSKGKHSMEQALETLSGTEVISIGEAYQNYRFSFLRQVIEMKTSRIERLLQEIKRVEEECCSVIKTIQNEAISREIQQVLSYQALPLFSDSSLIQSLIDLKQTSDFSSPKILDLLKTLNSSHLSSFPSFFSISASSSSTSPPLSAYNKVSSTPQSSVQTNHSQKFSTQTVNPTNYQWELLQQKEAHKAWISSIALSDCEKYLASASDDFTIKIWELQTLRLLRTLEGHKNYAVSVAFLGDKVVSGSWDNTIKIWEEDKCVKTLELHTGDVTNLCVSSCKRLILSGSRDATAVVFRLEDNKTLHTLKHSNMVYSVDFSHNSKEIVSGTTNGKIYIWKTETAECLKTLNAHSGYVTCLKYSGKLIVSSSQDKTVKIWDRDKNKPLFTFTDHTEYVVSVDIRDNIVVSLGLDDKIIVRDVRSGSIIQTLLAHKTSNLCEKMGLKILEGGNFIVSGGRDRNLRVWKRVN